ncbi:hypothetical protein HYV64_03495 [Candidatus Shapirobacteria bacterium]|nr:hypothetical protein [Candidatus Shapirobacteria bacterium]
MEFVYDESRFDPTQVRAMLGIQGQLRINLPPEERLRLADLLLRTGNISTEELASLRMRTVKICQK